MNRWRVGEDRGSKETDGCPLTDRLAPVLDLSHLELMSVFGLLSPLLRKKKIGQSESLGCKGTSIHFLTSPILSHSPPVHMYSPSSPLYYLQGPYLKPTTSRPNGPTTSQKSTNRQSLTSRVPICSYLNIIRWT
jgi:hypothetical protein